MKTCFILFAMFLSLCAAVDKVAVELDDKGERRIESIIRGILERQIVERQYGTDYQELNVVGFSWNNCGAATDPIQVHSLGISPDPIAIPGTETISFDISMTEDITNPTSVVLDVKKKLFGVFIDIPCVDNIGSCTYKNPCDLLKNITCPPIFKEHEIACKCPFPKGEKSLTNAPIKIPKLNLPSLIENGEYKVQATLYNGATRLGCYQVDASLKKA